MLLTVKSPEQIEDNKNTLQRRLLEVGFCILDLYLYREDKLIPTEGNKALTAQQTWISPDCSLGISNICLSTTEGRPIGLHSATFSNIEKSDKHTLTVSEEIHPRFYEDSYTANVFYRPFLDFKNRITLMYYASSMVESMFDQTENIR